ncbi:hypothetical protein [Synechococcus sp. Cruz-7B9]|nr:hypothetical protein [Synechococcus sp. Cruz-7B9]MCP9843326.1 hypothetical protein [Synechococcus sp. Edmonson 11F2]MCP9862735.1 hypothetical protein [Synechococcus sp. Cruz-7E5]
MRNDSTGDARICGSLASLAGLESALEKGDQGLIDLAINKILLLNGIIFSFGGIPLIYNGDALGLLNDYSYINDPSKGNDSRWVHRAKIDWEKAARRNQRGTVECTIFTAMKRMIAIRKEISAFADFNNRELLHSDNEHLLCFLRYNHLRSSEKVFVIANFDDGPQRLELDSYSRYGINPRAKYCDLYSGTSPSQHDGSIALRGGQFYWLSEI